MTSYRKRIWITFFILIICLMLVLWLQIELYTDSETFELMGKRRIYCFIGFVICLSCFLIIFCRLVTSPGKEHALVICNHRSDIDWLVGWVLAQVCFILQASLSVCIHYYISYTISILLHLTLKKTQIVIYEYHVLLLSPSLG